MANWNVSEPQAVPSAANSRAIWAELFYTLPYGRCASKDCGCLRFEVDPQKFSPKRQPSCTVCSHDAGFHHLGSDADRAYGMRRRQNVMNYLYFDSVPSAEVPRIEAMKIEEVQILSSHHDGSTNIDEGSASKQIESSAKTYSSSPSNSKSGQDSPQDKSKNKSTGSEEAIPPNSMPSALAIPNEENQSNMLPESSTTIDPLYISSDPSRGPSEAPSSQMKLSHQPADSSLIGSINSPEMEPHDEIKANQSEQVRSSPTPSLEQMRAVLASLRTGPALKEPTTRNMPTERQKDHDPVTRISLGHESPQLTDEEPSVQIWEPENRQKKMATNSESPAKYVPWWLEDSSTSSDHFQDDRKVQHAWEEDTGRSSSWSRANRVQEPSQSAGNKKQAYKKIEEHSGEARVESMNGYGYHNEHGHRLHETSAERRERRRISKAKGQKPPVQKFVQSPGTYPGPSGPQAKYSQRKWESSSSLDSKPKGGPGPPGQGSDRTRKRAEQKQRAKERAAAEEAMAGRGPSFDMSNRQREKPPAPYHGQWENETSSGQMPLIDL